MTHTYRVYIPVSILICTLILSGCMNMPMGYTRHTQLYKTVPPQRIDDAVLITQDQMGQIYKAVKDVTARLTERAGLAPKPVFVDTPSPATQIQTLVDNDLRDSLRRLGYTLSNSAETGYTIRHYMSPVNTNDGANVELRLDIYNSTQTPPQFLTSQSGLYRIDNFLQILK